MKSLNNSINVFTGFKNYTVESVLEGHPDKVCDQICDAILDAYLEVDESAKVAVECLGTGNFLIIGGEVFPDIIMVDVNDIAATVYEQIGYVEKLNILNKLNLQSEQLRNVILNGVAGDQGIMYGFACNSVFNYLPYGVYIVNALAKEIDLLRKRTAFYLPDGKVQISIKGDYIDTLIISIQHSKNSNIEQIKEIILNQAVSKIIPLENIKNIFINHKSNFIRGGFINDTGLSGRKIIIDTYCGLVPHGGGSFSGKDPSKIDRSATYMARFVAKNIVANELAKFCLICVAYAFGFENPVMLEVKTDNPKNDVKIAKIISEKFDFRPKAIIERLKLTKVKFRQTATYGHFFDSKYNWEQIITI